MAELNLTHPRKERSHRLPVRIDLTPMVDLGFLLITFFMLTTLLAQPTVLAMVMPDPDGAPEPLKASKVLTLRLGSGDRVFYYEGLDTTAVDSTDFAAHGLRRIVLEKMERVNRQFGLESYTDARTGQPHLGSTLNVIIRPTPESRYKNLVDALDEMAICRVRYYTVQ